MAKKKVEAGLFKISNSTISVFKECPRCFWLLMKAGIKRPRGIFPSLPGGMDIVIKKYCDAFRAADKIPPEMKDIPGRLFGDQERLKDWRNHSKTPLNYKYDDGEITLILSGALDDAILTTKDFIMPFDYKTRGYAITKETPKAYLEKYYQTQMSCYNLMLSSGGYKTAGIGIFFLIWPAEAGQNGIIKFDTLVQEIDAPKEHALAIIQEIAECLKYDIPDSAPDCEYCNHFSSATKWFTTRG